MKTANAFVTKSFSSFSSYAKHAKRWKLDFRKLDKGPFSGKLSILDIETVQVIRTQLSGIMDQTGRFQEGYRTFIIPSCEQRMGIWQDTFIEGNAIIAFPKHGSFTGVSYDNFDVFAVSIKECHFSDISKKCQVSENENLKNIDGGVYEIDEKDINTLRSMFQKLFDEISVRNDVIHSSEFSFTINYQLSHLILSALTKISVKRIKSLSRKRDRALRKAIEYIQNKINNNISIRKLAHVANTSERTLEYAFKERYGIAPKTYITYSKLNRIKEILSSQENREMVSTVAQQFGFKHMGQFSADYKNLLGELPRTTLLKIKEQ